ncbi:Tetratricopeptide repeat (TPR)-like superfamily protein [Forsythia ovata]|uniref:Tetratricopeptide repeat (TPR)-like superfamily protein n=1 Tax=Forsythia ovata TaxID=205694 RepID=A0ABD1QF92_9LAMI
MVAGKVKVAMGLQRSPANPKPKPDSSPKPSLLSTPGSTKQQQQPQKGSSTGLSRSFGVYFPRSSAQVQPRPPDVTELLRLVEELRERESLLKTELLEQKLLRASAAIVPVLENEISIKDSEIERSKKKIQCLEAENDTLREEVEVLHIELSKQNQKYEEKIMAMQVELSDIKKSFEERQREEETSSSSSTPRLADLTNNYKSSTVTKTVRKCTTQNFIVGNFESGISGNVRSESEVKKEDTVGVVTIEKPRHSRCNSEEIVGTFDGIMGIRSRAPRVPKPPPRPSALLDSNSRRDSSGGAADALAAGTTAKDMIGEIENRSTHLLAIKTDVETQGDFIRFLIKEVEGAAFTDIEDVVHFVKWLDDELSYLVDERAVLKHFDWPEQKADALREAAFGYCDLKKLESEASSFRDDPRQPCGIALKKMQALFEKLEHGVYNLSRMRESAAKRYKAFHIPMDWMLDKGYQNQIKLASVKLAMKHMKRVSAELEMVGCGPEEEDLIVQGVKFAFRVHQFAGGFDVETMRAFQELRDKARSCNVQCQNQQQQKFVCRSSTAC